MKIIVGKSYRNVLQNSDEIPFQYASPFVVSWLKIIPVVDIFCRLPKIRDDIPVPSVVSDFCVLHPITQTKTKPQSQ